MNALILNDIHIGAVRTAGTTPTSKRAIQQYLLDSFQDLIFSHTNKDLIILGDLFDSFEVETSNLLQTYMVLCDWIHETGNKVHLIRGNHDISKNSEKMSSFLFLCKLLKSHSRDSVFVYDEGLAQLNEHVWCIPHVINQDMFDIELEKALHIPPSFLLLHANLDNHFAEESDHSLNVSDEWIKKFLEIGHTPVFAHEHQHKRPYDEQVIVLGNQWPSSVADCLPHGSAQKDGKKYAYWLHQFKDGDDVRQRLERTCTWNAATDFAEIPWNELADTPARFIRVTGSATAEQAQDVITAIARYRQKSPAFVITNAVQVAGMDGMGDMPELTSERLGAIDVLDALCSELTQPEADAVRSLLNEEQQ